jgi:eukaryotic-like serine/threonine-protein kinase
MMLAVLTAAGAVVLGALTHITGRLDQARTALHDGQVQMAQGQWQGAIRTLQRGRAAVQNLPWQHDLAEALERQLRQTRLGQADADRTAAADALHQLADRVRFLYGAEQLAPEALHELEIYCGAFWDKRGRVTDRLTAADGRGLEATVRDDLLDLAIFWADLQARLAPPEAKEQSRRQALTVLAQAEALFGPSPVLDEERKLHGGARQGPGPPTAAHGGNRSRQGTAWEHYALGRALLRTGDLERAAEEVRRAVRMQPQGLWPNFYQGLCAYKQGRYADAVTAYSVCIGAAPQAAGCFYNRALAFVALGRNEDALRDYDQALRLDSTLALAALNRELLQKGAKR